MIDYLRENKKWIIPMVILCLSLVPILYLQWEKDGEKYLEDQGQVIGVYVDEEGISINVEGRKEGESLRKEVFLEQKKQETKGNGWDEASSKEVEIDTAITGAVRTLNTSQREEREVWMLPGEVGEGVELRWTKPEKGRSYLLPLLFMPLVLLYMYRDGKDKEKKRKVYEKNDIVMSIPAFNDRMLLLLGCGLIYEDAFNRIAEGYREGETLRPFGELLIKASDEAKATNSESIVYLAKEAGRLKIKELSRLTALIADNRFRGADLSEKLKQESGLLWNERRKKAEEMGKIAETKLSGPMALMLLVLILITAAPAIMQM